MKWLNIFLMSCILFLSSCSYDQKNYLLTGKTAEIKNLPLVYIIWYKPGKIGSEVVKSWDANDPEMETIRQLLLTAASEGKLPWHRWYKLSLFFYDGLPEHLKLKEISFDLKEVYSEEDKRNILFEGSAGGSYELGNLLSKYEFEKRVAELDPNKARIIEQVNKAQREAIKALRKREREPNQPQQKLSE